jgi:hypothetical protein
MKNCRNIPEEAEFVPERRNSSTAREQMSKYVQIRELRIAGMQSSSLLI